MEVHIARNEGALERARDRKRTRRLESGRDKENPRTHTVDATGDVSACYTTGSESTGRNKKVPVWTDAGRDSLRSCLHRLVSLFSSLSLSPRVSIPRLRNTKLILDVSATRQMHYAALCAARFATEIVQLRFR